MRNAVYSRWFFDYGLTVLEVAAGQQQNSARRSLADRLTGSRLAAVPDPCEV